MPSLIIAALVRNEEDRFWREILASWTSFADAIIVVDDGSTDATAMMAVEVGAHVHRRSAVAKAWGAEAPARAELFDIAWESAIEGDYILILDGDMTPLRSPKPMMETEADAVNFYLYDLWHIDYNVHSEHANNGITTPCACTPSYWYRSDSFWRAHLMPRPWMFKKRRSAKPPEGWQWPERGIHVGHFPKNLFFDSFAYAPPEFSLLHFGYTREDLRQEKYIAYASVAAELTDFERTHAISILDENPNLERLPFKPVYAV